MQAQADAGERVGPTSVELDEIKRLKRENKDLRDINDVLKAATSFFSSGSSTLATVHSQLHFENEKAAWPWHPVDLRCLRGQGVPVTS